MIQPRLLNCSNRTWGGNQVTTHRFVHLLEFASLVFSIPYSLFFKQYRSSLGKTLHTSCKIREESHQFVLSISHIFCKFTLICLIYVGNDVRMDLLKHLLPQKQIVVIHHNFERMISVYHKVSGK